MNLLNIPLVIAVFAVMLGFYILGRARKPFWIQSLFWVFIWLVGLYIIFKYAIIPPLPGSIVNMFMAIIAMALAIFISSDTQRQKEVTDPIIQFLADRRYNIPLAIFAVLIPMLVAWNVYRSGQESIVPPVEDRTIHPAPPGEITFREKTLNLNTLNNPYRELEVDDPDRKPSASTSKTAARFIIKIAFSAMAIPSKATDYTPMDSIPFPRTWPTWAPSRYSRNPTFSGGLPRADRDSHRHQVPGVRPCRPGNSFSRKKKPGT